MFSHVRFIFLITLFAGLSFFSCKERPEARSQDATVKALPSAGDSCTTPTYCLKNAAGVNQNFYCSGGGEGRWVPCKDGCISMPDGEPDYCKHGNARLFRYTDLPTDEGSGGAGNAGSGSGVPDGGDSGATGASGDMQSALLQAVDASCGRIAECGAGIKKLGSGGGAYWNQNNLLPSWSAAKLLMIAATVQRFAEIGTPPATLESTPMCGGNFWSAMEATLVDSSNPVPACILDYLQANGNIGSTRALDFVGTFAYRSAFDAGTTAAPIPGGYQLCGWEHLVGSATCTIGWNAMTPDYVVNTLDRIWTLPGLGNAGQTMRRYLQNRNIKLESKYPGLLNTQKPYLRNFLHKTGGQPQGDLYSFSDYGMLLCNGERYVYAYFDYRWVDAGAGTSSRFNFWQTLKNAMGCADEPLL